MYFGMPTLVELPGIVETVEKAVSLQLDFVEVNMSFPQYGAGQTDTALYRRLADQNGIFYTIHADESLNPFDFHPKVSACYFDLMRDTIRDAIAIGARRINMHLLKGVYVTLPDRVVLLPDVYRDAYMERVRAFVRMCEEEVGSADLRICIENVDSNPFTDAQLSALPVFLESPVFALTLDVGHDFCLGGKDAKVYERYSDRLLHLHLHDSDGRHAHLPLGTGSADLRSKLALLPEDGTCLIEVKTVSGLIESLNYAKKASLFER